MFSRWILVFCLLSLIFSFFCTEFAIETSAAPAICDFSKLPDEVFIPNEDTQEDFALCTVLTGSLNIGQISNATNVRLFSNVQKITGSLIVDNSLGTLISLLGQKNLVEIDGDLKITNNDDLLDLYGLNQLTKVGGSVIITDNPSLQQLNDIYNLVRIGQNLEIKNNAIIHYLTGFQQLNYIGGHLILFGLSTVHSFKSFRFLSYVGSYIQIDSLFSSYSIFDVQYYYGTGFEALTQINGDLIIQNNPYILDVKGFQNVKTITGSLIIQNNMNLTHLDGLASLTSVSKNIVIANNSDLLDIDGLLNLRNVTGALQFQNNPSLVSITGLCGLRVASSITLLGNQRNLCNTAVQTIANFITSTTVNTASLLSWSTTNMCNNTASAQYTCSLSSARNRCNNDSSGLIGSDLRNGYKCHCNQRTGEFCNSYPQDTCITNPCSTGVRCVDVLYTPVDYPRVITAPYQDSTKLCSSCPYNQYSDDSGICRPLSQSDNPLIVTCLKSIVSLGGPLVKSYCGVQITAIANYVAYITLITSRYDLNSKYAVEIEGNLALVNDVETHIYEDSVIPIYNGSGYHEYLISGPVQIFSAQIKAVNATLHSNSSFVPIFVFNLNADQAQEAEDLLRYIADVASHCLKPGLWFQTIVTDGSPSCKQCVKGGICLGNGEILPLAGYWSKNAHTAPQICDYGPSACPGFPPDLTIPMLPSYGKSSDGSTITDNCTAAYIGTRCETCSYQFYLIEGQQTCTSCPSQTESYIELVLLFSLSAAYFAAVGFAIMKFRDRNLSKVVGGIAFLQQIVSTLQSAAQGLHHYSAVFGLIIRFVGVANFSITFLQASCAFYFSFFQVYFVTLAFFVAVGVFFMSGAIIYAYRLPARRLRHRLRINIFKHRATHSLLILGSLVYLQFMTRSFQGLICQTNPDGVSVLVIDIETVCWEGEHIITVIVILLLLLVFGCGFPIYCVWTIYCIWNREADDYDEAHWAQKDEEFELQMKEIVNPALLYSPRLAALVGVGDLAKRQSQTGLAQSLNPLTPGAGANSIGFSHRNSGNQNGFSTGNEGPQRFASPSLDGLTDEEIMKKVNSKPIFSPIRLPMLNAASLKSDEPQFDSRSEQLDEQKEDQSESDSEEDDEEDNNNNNNTIQINEKEIDRKRTTISKITKVGRKSTEQSPAILMTAVLPNINLSSVVEAKTDSTSNNINNNTAPSDNKRNVVVPFSGASGLSQALAQRANADQNRVVNNNNTKSNNPASQSENDSKSTSNYRELPGNPPELPDLPAPPTPPAEIQHIHIQSPEIESLPRVEVPVAVNTNSNSSGPKLRPSGFEKAKEETQGSIQIPNNGTYQNKSNTSMSLKPGFDSKLDGRNSLDPSRIQSNTRVTVNHDDTVLQPARGLAAPVRTTRSSRISQFFVAMKQRFSTLPVVDNNDSNNPPPLPTKKKRKKKRVRRPYLPRLSSARSISESFSKAVQQANSNRPSQPRLNPPGTPPMEGQNGDNNTTEADKATVNSGSLHSKFVYLYRGTKPRFYWFRNTDFLLNIVLALQMAMTIPTPEEEFIIGIIFTVYYGAVGILWPFTSEIENWGSLGKGIANVIYCMVVLVSNELNNDKGQQFFYFVVLFLLLTVQSLLVACVRIKWIREAIGKSKWFNFLITRCGPFKYVYDKSVAYLQRLSVVYMNEEGQKPKLSTVNGPIEETTKQNGPINNNNSELTQTKHNNNPSTSIESIQEVSSLDSRMSITDMVTKKYTKNTKTDLQDNNNPYTQRLP